MALRIPAIYSQIFNMLQPKSKSFPRYIQKGYEYASGKKMNIQQISCLKKLSAIDDSVLILDDILDDSKLRNGKKCLHTVIGIGNAIVKAELLKSTAIKALKQQMSISNTPLQYQNDIFMLIHQHLEDIYR